MSILFENDIGLAIIVKNESAYMGEWLEYHYKIGVDKFYIYDNDSEDRSELMKILEPWIQKNIVEYFQLPGALSQIPAYIDAIKRFRFDCKYLGFIDCDEFIVPKNGRDLIDILDSVFKTELNLPYIVGGLAINWREFGSNGHLYREPGGVIERFTLRLKDDFDKNRLIKTVANPRRLEYTWMPHNFQYYRDCVAVNEHGKMLPINDNFFGIITHSPENKDNTVETVQINHYRVKSREEFVLKTQRGRSDATFKNDLDSFNQLPPDTVEDLTALEIFRKPIIRREKIVDDESTIRDMEFMLSESEHNFEQLLTCFHRASRLKNSEAREKYQISSLTKFIATDSNAYYETSLFFDTIPKIFGAKTRLSVSVIKKALQILEDLEKSSRGSMAFKDYNQYVQMKMLLESMI